MKSLYREGVGDGCLGHHRAFILPAAVHVQGETRSQQRVILTV